MKIEDVSLAVDPRLPPDQNPYKFWLHQYLNKDGEWRADPTTLRQIQSQITDSSKRLQGIIDRVRDDERTFGGHPGSQPVKSPIILGDPRTAPALVVIAIALRQQKGSMDDR